VHPAVDEYDLESSLDRAAMLLRRAERVAVFSGAGISAESGVPTFRGADGLWEGHRVEEVATPQAFERDPVQVWRFYNMRRARLATVQPNPGHAAIVELEQRWGPERFAVITQNIDGLHRAAGSRRVLELHGNLRRVRCTGCAAVLDCGLEPLAELPRCASCNGLLRPDVVWFHEMLPQDVWTEAAHFVKECGSMLVVGTSAVVYPAASLIELARYVRASVIEVNLERTQASGQTSCGLYGPSGQVLPRLVERLNAAK
jgi:NAD-dependent deacetylase